MKYVLNTKVMIDGVLYGSGTDITDIVTPGELVSLQAAGVIRTGKPAAEPEADDEPEPEAEPVDEELEVEEDLQDEVEPDEGTPIDVLDTLPEAVIEHLRNGNVTTIEKASQYLTDNGSFVKLKGIGRATSPDIEAALIEYLAAANG